MALHHFTLVDVPSERDIVIAICRDGSACLDLKAAVLMTTEIINCPPGDSLNYVMFEMTEKRFRHLPN